MTEQDGVHFDEDGLSSDRKDAPASSVDCTIGDLARETGVTSRALRFYQSKGLLAPHQDGHGRVFSSEDRGRLALILQGKRLGFTLSEIRAMLAASVRGNNDHALTISRRKCVEQINLLEHQRRDLDTALAELRQIYTSMFIVSDSSRPPASSPRKAS